MRTTWHVPHHIVFPSVVCCVRTKLGSGYIALTLLSTLSAPCFFCPHRKSRTSNPSISHSAGWPCCYLRSSSCQMSSASGTPCFLMRTDSTSSSWSAAPCSCEVFRFGSVFLQHQYPCLFMWIMVFVDFVCSQTHQRQHIGRRLHSEYEITAGKALGIGFCNTQWNIETQKLAHAEWFLFFPNVLIRITPSQMSTPSWPRPKSCRITRNLFTSVPLFLCPDVVCGSLDFTNIVMSSMCCGRTYSVKSLDRCVGENQHTTF